MIEFADTECRFWGSRAKPRNGGPVCFPVISLGMGGRGHWNEEMTRFFFRPTANGSLRSHANQVPTKLARQGFAAASSRCGGACGPSRPLVALAVPGTQKPCMRGHFSAATEPWEYCEVWCTVQKPCIRRHFSAAGPKSIARWGPGAAVQGPGGPLHRPSCLLLGSILGRGGPGHLLQQPECIFMVPRAPCCCCPGPKSSARWGPVN